MRRGSGGIPSAITEVLRFCVVVFGAAVGGQLAAAFEHDSEVRIGPFGAVELGLVLGAGLGYVVGGALARLTGRQLAAAEEALSRRSPEQLLAGLTGAVVGVMVAVGLTWPLLLIGSAAVVLPVFVFTCVSVGVLGYRVGLARRQRVLALLAPRTGLHEPDAPVSALPRILDTSVAIDGRIVDVVRAGFVHGALLVPQPVLGELQALADSGDDQRRHRGRRGLEVLEALRREHGVDVEVVPDGAPEVTEVDGKLIRMCLDQGAALLTLDTNLARVASLSGCRVANLHALALALRPPVAAGEGIRVHLMRPGKEPGQAVGYLDDGTMVVVERGSAQVGQEVSANVTSVLTTANGRMVFCRLVPRPQPPAP